jgi:DNA polymerase-3 subunit alpha
MRETCSHDGFNSSPKSEKSGAAEELKALCTQGLQERFSELESEGLLQPTGFAELRYRQRLDEELGALERAGLSAYLLAAAKLVTTVREGGPIAPPGQGSVCGSLAAWCLGITDVDPLRHGLFFERFLRPNHAVPGTIFLCLPRGTRGPALRRLRDSFTYAKLGHPCRTHTLEGPAAIREAALRLGLDAESADAMATYERSYADSSERFPAGLAGQALELVRQQGGKLVVAVPDESKLLFLAAPTDLPDDLPPLHSSQCAMGSWIGVDTPDTPGFQVLEFQWATELAKRLCQAEKRGVQAPAAAAIATNPQLVAVLVNCEGLWPFDGPMSLELATRLGISSFSDLCIVMAIDRDICFPVWQALLRNKENPRRIRYPIGELAPILDETYGVLVYQEQVTRIGVEIFGLTLCQAIDMTFDLLRRQKERLQYWRDQLLEKGSQQGLPPAATRSIAKRVLEHGKTAGLKAHAASRASTILLSAWLRTQMPEGKPN